METSFLHLPNLTGRVQHTTNAIRIVAGGLQRYASEMHLASDSEDRSAGQLASHACHDAADRLQMLVTELDALLAMLLTDQVIKRTIQAVDRQVIQELMERDRDDYRIEP